MQDKYDGHMTRELTEQLKRETLSTSNTRVNSGQINKIPANSIIVAGPEGVIGATIGEDTLSRSDTIQKSKLNKKGSVTKLKREMSKEELHKSKLHTPLEINAFTKK